MCDDSIALGKARASWRNWFGVTIMESLPKRVDCKVKRDFNRLSREKPAGFVSGGPGCGRAGKSPRLNLADQTSLRNGEDGKEDHIFAADKPDREIPSCWGNIGTTNWLAGGGRF